MRAKSLACVCLLGACQPPSQVASSFGTSITTTPAGTSSSSSTNEASAGSSSGTSTSAGTEDSTAGAGSSTTLVLDVGAAQDVMNPQPVGCQGKIDFLFVISRYGIMEEAQAGLVAAFPGFIETIQTKFADFDYHIMVVDDDQGWGSMTCSGECPQAAGDCDGYPCDYVPSVCDEALGAGTVFNAGWNAPNLPCELASGRRYIDKSQANLTEAFACIAQVGTSGGNWPGAAVAAAMKPEQTDPGGCNEGFLRDDALLMITFIAQYDVPLHDSPGKPAEWAQAILDAKHGDKNAVVMFSFGDLTCPPYDRICDLVLWYFPYHHIADWNTDDYGPGFDVATDLVETACSAFIPE